MDRKQFAVCRNCLVALTNRRTSVYTQNGRAAIESVRSLRTGPLAYRSRIRASPVQRTRQASTSSDKQPATLASLRDSKQQDLSALHGRVLGLTASTLKPPDGPVPSEQRVLYVLEQLEAIAKSLVDANSLANAASIKHGGNSATSALLGSVNTRQTPASISKGTLLNLINHKAEEIIRHPNVFITAPILKAYVQLQTLLQQPASFPEVFNLYATKPTPSALGDGKVKYVATSSNSLSAAIDKDTANTALSAAITAHDLTLTLDIIETAFAAPAYARAKVIRQGAVPGTALTAAPFVVYGLSSVFSATQTMLDPGQATIMAFAGFMTYFMAVGSVGYVAITTSNDQMDRITWAQGVPLWERWLKEEERAALDRVAGAWGFKSLEKRGDEEGEEWEILRETCGLKGMVLDKVELMEGME